MPYKIRKLPGRAEVQGYEPPDRSCICQSYDFGKGTGPGEDAGCYE